MCVKMLYVSNSVTLQDASCIRTLSRWIPEWLVECTLRGAPSATIPGEPAFVSPVSMVVVACHASWYGCCAHQRAARWDLLACLRCVLHLSQLGSQKPVGLGLGGYGTPYTCSLAIMCLFSLGKLLSTLLKSVKCHQVISMHCVSTCCSFLSPENSPWVRSTGPLWFVWAPFRSECNWQVSVPTPGALPKPNDSKQSRWANREWYLQGIDGSLWLLVVNLYKLPRSQRVQRGVCSSSLFVAWLFLAMFF